MTDTTFADAIDVARETYGEAEMPLVEVAAAIRVRERTETDGTLGAIEYVIAARRDGGPFEDRPWIVCWIYYTPAGGWRVVGSTLYDLTLHEAVDIAASQAQIACQRGTI